MKLKNFKNEAERTHHWQYIQILSVIIPFVLATSFYLTFYEQIHFQGGQFTFSLALSAINLILAGTYFYTYRHFADNFYFFISVTWLATAINLMLDVNGPTDLEHRSYKLGVYLLSLTPNIFLVLALLCSGSKKIIPRNYWVLIRIVIAGLLSIGILYVFITHEPNIIRIRLASWMIPGSLTSFILLCAVGDVLRGRFGEADVGWAEMIRLMAERAKLNVNCPPWK